MSNLLLKVCHNGGDDLTCIRPVGVVAKCSLQGKRFRCSPSSQVLCSQKAKMLRMHRKSLQKCLLCRLSSLWVIFELTVFCRYYKLDTSKTLKECLANKTVVEFPTFHVVLPGKTASYPTSDPEETCTTVTESLKEKQDSCEQARMVTT